MQFSTPPARPENCKRTVVPERQLKITDLAPVSTIMELQFRPAQRAGSCHLMTDDELAETIKVVEEKKSAGLPNATESLALLRQEQHDRLSDDLATRTARLRHRIAWEVTQERKEAERLRYRSSASDLPVRYVAPPKA